MLLLPRWLPHHASRSQYAQVGERGVVQFLGRVANLALAGEGAEVPELLLLLKVIDCCDQGNHCHSCQDGCAFYPPVVAVAKGQLQCYAEEPADHQHDDREVFKGVAQQLPEGYLRPCTQLRDQLDQTCDIDPVQRIAQLPLDPRLHARAIVVHHRAHKGRKAFSLSTGLEWFSRVLLNDPQIFLHARVDA